MAVDVPNEILDVIREYGNLLKENNLSEFYWHLNDELRYNSLTGKFTQLLLDSGMSIYDIFDYLIEELPPGIFYRCTLPDVLHVPKGITTIGSYAFSNCEGIRELYFNANSIVLDGSGTFAVSDIEKIILPELEEGYIPADCFLCCNELKEIVLTATAPYLQIGRDAFAEIPDDCKIYVPKILDGTIDCDFGKDEFLSHVIWI